MKVFLEPPRDEINKGNNAEKEKKRTKDGQRKLPFRREQEGERKDSLDGVHNLKLTNATEGKALGTGGQVNNTILGGVTWICWVW